MHACNHPEYGEILSAQCKKSCGRCGDGCATATGSTAHGRGGGDDDSAGSRKIDENNLDLSDKDVYAELCDVALIIMSCWIVLFLHGNTAHAAWFGGNMAACNNGAPGYAAWIELPAPVSG